MKMVYYVMVANIKHYDGREPISDSREYFYYGMATDRHRRSAPGDDRQASTQTT